jgi:hypothetical protein
MLFRPGATLAAFVSLLPAAVPAPKERLGFTPGVEKKLANYQEIIGYFRGLGPTGGTSKLVLNSIYTAREGQ